MGKKVTFTAILLLALWGSGAPASDMDKLLELDLKSLGRMVYATSRKLTAIEQAPGVVSVITAEDIRRFGGQNLYDVLERSTNLYPLPHQQIGDNAFSMRGMQLVTWSDNRLLLLLNGRPVRDSFNGSFNVAIYRNMPLDAIARIEIIRGPGSVIYGSGAFFGVINIVTHDPGEREKTLLALGAGSDDTYIARASSGFAYKGFEGYVAGRGLVSDGWRFAATDQNGSYNKMDISARDYGVFGQIDWRNFSLSGLVADEDGKKLHYIPLWPGVNKGKQTTRGRLLDAEYRHPLGDQWDATYNLTYNGFDMVTPTTPDATQLQMRDGDDLLMEATLRGRALDGRINLLTGLTYQRLKTRFEGGAGIGTYRTNWYNGYLQLDYAPWDWVKLVGGVQFNKPEHIDMNISKRAGVIFQFNSQWGAKLLYGEAFRSPSALEYSPFLRFYNPDLEPELVTTWDAQLFFNTPGLRLALTFYHSRQEETITRAFVGDVLNLTNQGEIVYRGVELEGQYEIDKTWQLQGSVSYQESKDRMSRETQVNPAPRVMGRLGLSYFNPEQGLTLGLHHNYHCGFRDTTGTKRNPDPNDYHWLTLNGEIQLNSFLSHPPSADITLSLEVDNLLDEKVYQEESFFPEINTLPSRNGRQFFFQVELKF